MEIRLYLDEDSMDNDLVQALRARNVDVTTARETDMLERQDEEQLKFATEQGRVLYSFNVGDFFQLHTQFLTDGRSHCGIVVAKQQQYSVGEQLRRLLKLIGEVTREEIENRIEFLNDWD